MLDLPVEREGFDAANPEGVTFPWKGMGTTMLILKRHRKHQTNLQVRK